MANVYTAREDRRIPLSASSSTTDIDRFESFEDYEEEARGPLSSVRVGSTLYIKVPTSHWLGATMVAQFQPLASAHSSLASSRSSSPLVKGQDGYDSAVEVAANSIHLYLPSGLVQCAKEIELELIRHEAQLGRTLSQSYFGPTHHLYKILLSLNASVGWRAKFDDKASNWFYINLVDRSVKGWHMEELLDQEDQPDGHATWADINPRAADLVSYAKCIRIPNEIASAIQHLRRDRQPTSVSQVKSKDKPQWLSSMLGKYVPADSHSLSEVSPIRRAGLNSTAASPITAADDKDIRDLVTSEGLAGALQPYRPEDYGQQDRYDLLDRSTPFGSIAATFVNAGYPGGPARSEGKHFHRALAARQEGTARRTEMALNLLFSDESNNRNKLEHEFTLLYLLVVKPLWRRDALEQQEKFGRERLCVWEMAEATKIYSLSMPNTATITAMEPNTINSYVSARSYTTTATSLLTFILSPVAASAVATMRRPLSANRADVTPAEDYTTTMSRTRSGTPSSRNPSPSPRRHYYEELYSSSGNSPMVSNTETVFRSAYFLFTYQLHQMKAEERKERQEVIRYSINSIQGIFSAQPSASPSPAPPDRYMGGLIVREASEQPTKAYGKEHVSRSKIALEEENIRSALERQFRSTNEALRFRQFQNQKVWSSLLAAIASEESTARQELDRSESIVRITIARRLRAVGDSYIEERVNGLDNWSRRLDEIGSPSFRNNGSLRGHTIDPYAYVSPSKDSLFSPAARPQMADESIILSPLTVASPSQPRPSHQQPPAATTVDSGDVLALVEWQDELFASFTEEKEQYIAAVYASLVGPSKAYQGKTSVAKQYDHMRVPITRSVIVTNVSSTSNTSASVIDAAYEQLQLKRLQAAATSLEAAERFGRKAEWTEHTTKVHKARQQATADEAHLVNSLPTSLHTTPAKRQPARAYKPTTATVLYDPERSLASSSRLSRVEHNPQAVAAIKALDMLSTPFAADDSSYFSKTYTEEIERLQHQRHQRATKVYMGRMERMLQGEGVAGLLQASGHNSTFLKPHRRIAALEAEEGHEASVLAMGRFEERRAASKENVKPKGLEFLHSSHRSDLDMSPRPLDPYTARRNRTQILSAPALPTNVILSPRRVKEKVFATSATQSEPPPAIVAPPPTIEPKPKSSKSMAIQTERPPSPPPLKSPVVPTREPPAFVPTYTAPPPPSKIPQRASSADLDMVEIDNASSVELSDEEGGEFIPSPHHEQYHRSLQYHRSSEDIRPVDTLDEDPEPMAPSSMEILHWDSEGIAVALAGEQINSDARLPIELTAGAVGILKISNGDGPAFGIGSAGVSGGLFIYEVLFKLVPTAGRLRRVGIHNTNRPRSTSPSYFNANRSVSMGSMASMGTSISASPSKAKGWSEIFAPSSSQFNAGSGIHRSTSEGTYSDGGLGVALGFTSREFHSTDNTFAYLYCENGSLSVAADASIGEGHSFGDDLLAAFSESFLHGRAGGAVPEKIEVRVTAVLDLDQRELSFIVNGKQQGVAFQFDDTDPDDVEPLFPLALLSEVGDEAWLVKPSV